MKIKSMVGLLLLLVVVIFSVQNADVITVRFLIWKFELSQALVILLSAFCGLVAGLAISAIGGIQKALGSSGKSGS